MNVLHTDTIVIGEGAGRLGTDLPTNTCTHVVLENVMKYTILKSVKHLNFIFFNITYYYTSVYIYMSRNFTDLNIFH